MDHYETINNMLVDLFNHIMDIEQKSLITEEFSDITNNDMHIIEAIGIKEPRNMSSVARTLSVTVGTLTIAINNLVKKGYVVRNRSTKDRRVVFIQLSERGRKAYDHHKTFHREMVAAVMDQLSEEELHVLVLTLKKLEQYFSKKQRKSLCLPV